MWGSVVREITTWESPIPASLSITLGQSVPWPEPPEVVRSQVDQELKVQKTREEWRQLLREHAISSSPSMHVFRTELARKAWEARQRVVASGAPLLSWREILAEVQQRRGDT